MNATWAAALDSQTTPALELENGIVPSEDSNSPS